MSITNGAFWPRAVCSDLKDFLEASNGEALRRGDRVPIRATSRRRRDVVVRDEDDEGDEEGGGED